MKDTVWVVEQRTQYDGDVELTVTTNRDSAVRMYQANKGDADAWVGYCLSRWENGHFVEHEMETD